MLPGLDGLDYAMPVMPSDPNVNVGGPQTQGSQIESLGSKQA